MALEGFTGVRGTEFGEVDNPAYGGYTEAGWNHGAFGDNISGWDTTGFALPPSVLKSYGYGSKNFGSDFNANYEIQAYSPATGKIVTGPLKDLGPGPKTGAGIDILAGSRAGLGLEKNFSGPIQYRIVPKGTPVPEGTSLASGNQSGSPTPMWAQSGGTPPTGIASATDTTKPFQPAPTTTGTDPALAEQIRQLQAALALTQNAQQPAAPQVSANQPGQDYASLNLAPAAGGGGTGNYALIQAIRMNRIQQALRARQAAQAGGKLVQGLGQMHPGTGGTMGGFGGTGGMADPFEPGGSMAFG